MQSGEITFRTDSAKLLRRVDVRHREVVAIACVCNRIQ